MSVVRVLLHCTAPAPGDEGGLFGTVVRVTREEFERDEHLRIACRRAMILGYGGPHRVVRVSFLTRSSIHSAPTDLFQDIERDESAVPPRTEEGERHDAADGAVPTNVEPHRVSASWPDRLGAQPDDRRALRSDDPPSRGRRPPRIRR